ncbi:hypothetical protein QBK99_09940 [Corticibacterium sp. UT-5YL-CI-8]|nr:hypothetical protein [Tianweitania sp. UT-5YL-CI-8]
MKTLRSFLTRAIAAVCVGGLAVSQSFAAPMPAKPQAQEFVVQVAGDCYAIGQQVAAQNGGQLARATAQNRGGQTVCVIVVLVPGRDGERPRRAEFVVPAN